MAASNAQSAEMLGSPPPGVDIPGAPAHVPPAGGTSQINVGRTERIASVVGGSLLALYGLRNFSKGGFLWTLTGGYLLYRGASGNCPVNTAIGRNSAEGDTAGVNITRTVTIHKPVEEVYGFWRQLENLPRFMQHLSEVTQSDNRRSHWVAQVPGGLGTIAWDAEITHEEPNQRITWTSVPGAQVDNAGEVQFRTAPGNRGTEVWASISYRPPAGAVGSTLAKWLNPVLAQLVKEDLRRFKRIMEAGELPTIEGQPSGRGNDHDPFGNPPISKALL